MIRYRVDMQTSSDTTITSYAQSASLSAGRLWTGRIITGLLVVFLIFDAVAKIIQIDAVVTAAKQLGLNPQLNPYIGAVLLVCTAIYIFPRTAVFGAILLTGYLGGAAAIHVRAENGAFPVAFAIGFGVLAWVGLVLREPQLLRVILQR